VGELLLTRADRPGRKGPGAGAPLEYHYDDGTTKRVYAAEEILHVPGFGFNGLVGLSRIRYAAEALGEGVAQERFAASWYAGGGTPRILLRHPRTLSPKAKANLARAWSEAYSGHQAYHEPAILEEGTEVENLTMPFEDMQLLETRRFKVTDIARLYRVPPHMLAETDKSTSWGSGIEAQTRGLKVFAAGPIGSRFEQVMTARLLTKAEQAAGFFIAFNFDAMSRADLEARYRAYSIGRQNGWLSSNDVRRRENLDPIDDPSADLYWQPLNMVPMSSPAAMGTEPRHQVEAAELLEVRTGAAAPRLALRDRFEPIVRERFDEVVRREVADIGRASSKINSRSVADFSKWLRDFYRDHRAYVDGKLRGVLTTLAELAGELAAAEAGGELSPAALERSIDEYIVARVDRWTEARHNVLLADIREAQRTNSDPLAAITDRLEQWTETSAATEANRETIAVTEAAGRAAWAALGITTMVWRLNGDSCPICRGLEGRTVSIHRAFLDAGVAHEFEGRPPFRPNRAVRGAPAHPGCKCYTAPVME